jgi:uncharacterized membrane protein YdjX (TVP38/TMEM64 family)
MKSKHRIITYSILTILFMALVAFVFYSSDFSKYGSPEYLRGLILSSGNYGYLIVILVIISSIMVPIPSVPAMMAAGYVYGNLTGSIISFIGINLGSILAFYLVRHLGRPVLEKLVDKHHIKHFNHILHTRGPSAVLIAFAIPIFPNDAVALMLGLTDMRLRKFLFLSFIGHIPRILLLTSLGNGLQAGFTASTILILIGTIIFVLIALFRERFKKLFFKELHELERETKKVERVFLF